MIPLPFPVLPRRMKACPRCGLHYARREESCPHCKDLGEVELQALKDKHAEEVEGAVHLGWLFLFLAGIAVLLVIVLMLG